MRLQDITLAFQGIGARLRRDAIGYGICAICAIAALILATWASVLALLPVVGAVYAQLIVAGFFVARDRFPPCCGCRSPTQSASRPAAAAATVPLGAQDNGQRSSAIRTDRDDHRSGDARLHAVAAALTVTL